MQLPKSDRWEKPDFMADETRYKEKAQGDFYNSSKVLGVLFRRVELPAEPVSEALHASSQMNCKATER